MVVFVRRGISGFMLSAGRQTASSSLSAASPLCVRVRLRVFALSADTGLAAD